MNIVIFIVLLLHFFYREYLLWKYKSSRPRNKWRLFDLIIFVALPLLQLYYRDVGKVAFLDNYILRVIGFILFLIGFIFSVWGKYTLSTLWATGWEYKIKDNHSIIENGPFRYFSHPIYVGVLLLCIGFELYLANVGLFVALLIIIPLFYKQTLKEEKILFEHFGEKYIKFKKSRLFF